jgi:hypothetical protein
MSDLESRVSALELSLARIDEKLSALPKIEAQLTIMGNGMITRHECRQSHEHTDTAINDLKARVTDIEKTSNVRMWAIIMLVIAATITAVFSGQAPR